MSSQAGKLRSNYRAADEAGDLGNALLGSNFLAGSFGGGAGASFIGGGLIVGSFASLIAGNSFHALSAQGVISAYYGTVPGATGSGWKFFPFDIMDMSADGAGSSVNVIYGYSATQGIGGTDSVIIITLKKALAGSAGSVQLVNASQISVHFLYTGFITSSAS